MQAIWVKSNGETKKINPKNGKDFKFEELKKYVGGYIEIVRLSAETIMVCNEDGLALNLPANTNATLFTMVAPYTRLTAIVGDVVICNTNQVK